MVNSLASGNSATQNWMDDFCRAAINSTSRESLSSLATINLAPFNRQQRIAFASSGRSFRLPDSTSVYSPRIDLGAAGVQVVHHRHPLGVKT